MNTKDLYNNKDNLKVHALYKVLFRDAIKLKEVCEISYNSLTNTLFLFIIYYIIRIDGFNI